MSGILDTVAALEADEFRFTVNSQAHDLHRIRLTLPASDGTAPTVATLSELEGFEVGYEPVTPAGRGGG